MSCGASSADSIAFRYVGLALAMSSALAIGMFHLVCDSWRRVCADASCPSGTSFVITKKVRSFCGDPWRLPAAGDVQPAEARIESIFADILHRDYYKLKSGTVSKAMDLYI
jgi:hypothetical protein